MKLRIKDISTKVGSGVTPRGGAEVYQETGIPLYRSQNVTDDGFITDSIAHISKEIDEEMSGTRIKPGDVLLNITGASIGRCYYTDDSFKCGNVNQHVCIIRPRQKVIIPAYLHLLLVSKKGKDYINISQTGSGREGLTSQVIRNFSFDIPPLSVQQRIVSYLDDKTAKIDRAVLLLQKKRDAYTRWKSSIINRAVTRGLNPNVKLKDSGIEWIGMIPENWIIRRFKEVFSHYTTGFTPESKNANNFEGHNTWITIADMIQKYVSESNLCLSDEAVQKAQQPITPKGSLLFSFKLSIGKVAFAEKDLYTNEAIVSLMPSSRYKLDFFYYYLPIVCFNNATENIYGAKMLNQKIISNMIFALPSLEEQCAIASYLDTHCSRIDNAISIVDKQIDAYKRLKKSLINEVVTGRRQI